MPVYPPTIALSLFATGAAAQAATEAPCLAAPERRLPDFWLDHQEVLTP